MLLDLEEYDDLIPLCDVILTLGKPSAKFYELRGIAKNKIGDFSGAIGDYTQALDLSLEADRPRFFAIAAGRMWPTRRIGPRSMTSTRPSASPRRTPTPTWAKASPRHGSACIVKLRMLPKKPSSTAMGARMFTFRVARVYCEAIVAVRREARTNRQDFDRPVFKYQEIAVKLIGLAVARTRRRKASGLFSRDDPERSRREADPQDADGARAANDRSTGAPLSLVARGLNVVIPAGSRSNLMRQAVQGQRRRPNSRDKQRVAGLARINRGRGRRIDEVLGWHVRVRRTLF